MDEMEMYQLLRDKLLVENAPLKFKNPYFKPEFVSSCIEELALLNVRILTGNGASPLEKLALFLLLNSAGLDPNDFTKVLRP